MDYSSMINAINFIDLLSLIIVISTSLMVVYVGIKGAQIALNFIGGDKYFIEGKRVTKDVYDKY